MGCDIHLFVETLNKSAGAWSFPTDYAGSYGDRNYELFAILAGVRNDGGTVPMPGPRGIPEDASDAYRVEIEDDWYHSHSWFTLAELLAHDWDGETAGNTALVHPCGGFGEDLADDFDFDAFAAEVKGVLELGGIDAMFKRWPQIGMCASVYGRRAHEWRRVNWTTTHRHQADSHWFEFLDGLQEHATAKGLTADEIRIVFFFDS